MRRPIILLTLCCSLLSASAQIVIGESSQTTAIGSAEQLLQQARCQYDDGAYITTGETLTRLERLCKDSNRPFPVEAARLRAMALYQQDAASAIGAIEQYLNDYPEAPDYNDMTARLATAYYTAGDRGMVMALGEAVDMGMLSNSERDRLLIVEAMALIEVGDIEEADIRLRTLANLSDSYGDEVAFCSAYIDYAEGRFDEALTAFDRLALSAQDATLKSKAAFYEAELLLEEGRCDEATTIAIRLLDDGSLLSTAERTEALRIKGESLYGTADYADAATTLEDYLSTAAQPQRNALYKLAMSHFLNGDYGRAPEIFHMVIADEDEITQNALLHSALCQLENGSESEARLLFESAAAMDADRSVKEQAMYNYLVCIHQTNYSAFGENVAKYEQFLNEFPDSKYAEQASAYLAETYMSTKSYDAALQSIAKIRKPDKGILKAKQSLLYRSGLEALAGGQVDEAESKFSQSLQLSGYDAQTAAEAHLWRAEAYTRQGNETAALRDYNAYLSAVNGKGVTAGHKATGNTLRNHALALYGQGYSLFNAQNYDDAYTAFRAFTGTKDVATLTDATTVADAHMRIGDCYFQARRYADAEDAYNKAIAADASTSDYATYRKAFALGLMGRYPQKASTLEQLVNDYPASDYADDALYEMGRAYVQMEKGSSAIKAFGKLISDYPQSPYAATAGNEIALIHIQNDRIDEAIKAYKQVVVDYPNSEAARVAIRDLKSLYVEENRIDSYTEFAAQVGMGSTATSELDSLTYTAAEMAYTRGDTKEAKASLQKYLQQYPNGRYHLDAAYYLGCIDYTQDNYTDARRHLKQVADAHSSRYCEEATRLLADITYNHKDYADAADVYRQLKGIASRSELRLYAQQQLVRCAVKLDNQEEVIAEATPLLADKRLDADAAIEMRYLRGKAYFEREADADAAADFAILAKDMRSAYGAEAAYLLADIRYESGDLAAARSQAEALTSSGTSHVYWVARAFILLSDICRQEGNTTMARAYLNSLKQNYTNSNDDILSTVEHKLAELK